MVSRDPKIVLLLLVVIVPVVAYGAPLFTDSGGGQSLLDGPDDIAKEYFNARFSGDVDRANELLHNQSESYPLYTGYSTSAENSSIERVEQVSVREIVEWQINTSEQRGPLPPEEMDDAVNRQESQFEELVSQTDSDQYQLLLVSVNASGEVSTGPVVMLETDGEWFVYQ